jgi:galactokinase
MARSLWVRATANHHAALKCNRLAWQCMAQCCVRGVPASFTGSGLSSSAAFVCSSFIAILSVHDIHVPRDEVAEYSAKAER